MGLVDVSLGDILGGIGSLAKDFREAIKGEGIKDPNKAMEFEVRLRELAQASELAQNRVNEIEAGHASIFVAGWRPALGWVAAVSLAFMYIPKSIVMTSIWTYQCIEIVSMAQDVYDIVLPAFPELGAMDIIGLVGSMLGVGIMRSYDKKQGTDTKIVTKVKK